ncbi:unnamed protein product [Rotaria sp. Silwood2]|nr:unnamed protein product [Rotaria sp. Silwood2]CAF3884428.1 unnamed protein product [Rotaria sp. Silwood2]
MFSSLFKHLIIQQQKIFRLQIKTLSTVKDGVNDIRDTGIVKRFSQHKGFGFIKRDSNGNDIFVHFQSILGTGFKTLQEGQQVEFKVFQGVKGLEARVNIYDYLFFLICILNFLFLLNVIVKDQLSDMKTSQVETFKTLTNDRHIGIIRKFIKNRGFGFITRKSDGADLFVHSRSIRHTGLESLEEGMEVEFLEVQSDRGAEAKDVRIINKTDSIENTRNQKQQFGITNDQYSDTKINEQETGIIKQWNKERGFGFVRRTLNGKDLFVHAKSLKENLQELEIGQQIQFRIQQTEKGEEASDVYLIKSE